VKTAGFFKGLQTARQKHERDYFVVRLRLTIPERMNCTPKVGCQRIFAGSFSADPAFRAEQLRSFNQTQRSKGMLSERKFAVRALQNKDGKAATIS